MTTPVTKTWAEHRLKTGTLTFAGIQFQTRVTNVHLEPDADEDGDRLETLSGHVQEPDERTTWTLNVEVIQDFDDPTGFVNTCMDKAGQSVAFTWKPNSTTGGATFTGTVRCRAVTIGGDVNKRLDTGAEFPVLTGPTRSHA